MLFRLVDLNAWGKVVNMLDHFKCWIGWHKWLPVPGTVTRKDKYTVEADLFCDRSDCQIKSHGEQENYW